MCECQVCQSFRPLVPRRCEGCGRSDAPAGTVVIATTYGTAALCREAAAGDGTGYPVTSCLDHLAGRVALDRTLWVQR